VTLDLCLLLITWQNPRSVVQTSYTNALQIKWNIHIFESLSNCEIVEMIDRFPEYIKTMQSCSSCLTPAYKVFRDRMTTAHMYCISSASETWRGNMKLHAFLCLKKIQITIHGNYDKDWRLEIKICHFWEFHKSRWINKRHKSRVTIIKKIRRQRKLGLLWCLDNWSWILSGKPVNTFSMARLKTLQFRPLFTATHAFLLLSFTILFHDLRLG
jgi:hypothetical protein